MASITNRDGRWRALVRRKGFVRCQTFSSRRDAKAWAEGIEAQVSETAADGLIQPRGLSIGDLIARYIREIYPIRPWGRSKTADLARLSKDLGAIPAGSLTAQHLNLHFMERSGSAGGVVIGSQLGYLIGVLKTARAFWRYDVPLKAAEDARHAMSTLRLISKSRRRDRRVTDAEVSALCDHFAKQASGVPMADIVQFCLASGMRISEVCRIAWRDLDEGGKAVMIRDRKHPRDKIGNDSLVPLLAATGFDAYEIIKRQPTGNVRIFPYNKRTVGTYFTEAVAALKLEDLHLHDLRHEAITRLFAAGLRIEQVALCSGHRDWAQLKRYTHPAAKDVHATLRART